MLFIMALPVIVLGEWLTGGPSEGLTVFLAACRIRPGSVHPVRDLRSRHLLLAAITFGLSRQGAHTKLLSSTVETHIRTVGHGLSTPG